MWGVEREAMAHGLTAYAYYRVGPLHRETAWLGVGLRGDS